ncbi:type II toxin-antitoxin system Phd/YefM family antitoxin [Nocardiopsis alkaliphila]|nr:type II toxin-antitoxin system Phd/YefM family antitoxin [Nocardiopsis alkaliphila]
METIPITEAKAEIAELTERAQREHADHTFTKNGRPAVVMMSVWSGTHR